MKKKITSSTGFAPLGYPVQSKLFRVASGEFAGRRAALIATAAGTLSLFRSDSPGTAWMSPVVVAEDANDRSFDAVMLPGGDIHVVYGETATNYLVTRKLIYADGAWSVGEKVTVYNGGQCYSPSLAADSAGRFWVAWARYAAPSRVIYAKSSLDDGASWGSGPEDIGDQIQSAATFAGVKLLTDYNQIYALTYDQDTGIYMRSRPLADGEWSARQTIVAGSGFTVNFDAAVAPNGHLGLVYELAGLHYSEYDGAGWSAAETITETAPVSPQLRFVDNIPAVTFAGSLGTGARASWYCDRRRGLFGTPQLFDRASGRVESVLLYDATTGAFVDLTSAAGDAAAGDLFHPASGALLSGAEDAVYLGMDICFRMAHFYLTTPGVGGTLRFAYWDGLDWQTFAPADGPVDLSATDNPITLWYDYNSIPANWQKRSVDGQSRFWVRIDVLTPFTTPPLGDQVTAATEITALSLRR